MFGNKMRIGRIGGGKRFDVGEVVREIARASGITLDYNGCGADAFVTAERNRKTVSAPLFKNDEPEMGRRWNYDGVSVEYQIEASFTPEDAIAAIVAALGLELRAEYVVGSAEPQIVAVKATPAKRKR